jgi:hypothetical protein
MTSKWSQLQTPYHEAASRHKVRPYQSKGESGGSGDTSMDSKVEEASKDFRHFRFMHVNFSNMPKLNSMLVTEQSGEGEPVLIGQSYIGQIVFTSRLKPVKHMLLQN